jgi:hypothetical protein
VVFLVRLSLLVLGCLLFSGCFWRLEQLTEALETRHVASCIFSVGFPYPFILVRVVTVTGGASIETCKDIERLLGP